MSVVDETAFVVPDVFAADTGFVTNAEAGDAFGEIDVVDDEQSLAGCELDDKPLMAAAVGVIG